MYNAFFEFEKNPFAPNPDPAFFFPSQQHDTTLRSLTFAVHSRMGLAYLAGQAGTGKTLLLQRLRTSLESAGVPCALLPEARLSTNRFFQAIASELKLPCQGASAYQVFSAVHQFAREQARKGNTVALIVDDAHELSADVLSEILQLVSLRDEKVRLLQAVLGGRPELHATLDSLNLERLRQHAILGCHLDPFAAEETTRYIEFRLAKAGLASQAIFPPEAMAEIYNQSRGFAPAIHSICEALLLAAFSAQSKVCTPEIMEHVFGKRLEQTRVSEAQTVDEAHRIATSEPAAPEPAGRLFPIAGAAIKSGPPPLPLHTRAPLAHQDAAPRWISPRRTVSLPVREFPNASKQAMRLMDAVSAGASIQSAAESIPAAVAPSDLVLPKPALSNLALRAELREMSRLQKLRTANSAPLASAKAVSAMPTDFLGAAVQPVSAAVESFNAKCELAIQGQQPPLLSFDVAGVREASPSGQTVLENLPVSRHGPTAPNIAASCQSEIPEQANLVRLPWELNGIALPHAEPIRGHQDPVQSLRPVGPNCNLQALTPRNSLLLLANWKPAREDADGTDAGVVRLDALLEKIQQPASFNPKWVLILAIPILSAITLYGLLPGMTPDARGALNRGWQRAQQAVLARAAVTLQEDFRAGLDDWMQRSGGRPSWNSDAAGFVHPVALALYRPSLGLTDYRIQFVGTIDKKALSWVVRAADFDNYYVVRLGVLKPGPVPVIGVTRYAVEHGKPQNQVTTKLLMNSRPDTVYRVSLDVQGNRFSLSVQDQPVDSWSEPKLLKGGIGFFSEQDAGSRIAAVRVNGQDDLLGRLCAFLAPSGAASYLASLNDRAALNLKPEMNAQNGDRGGSSSPSAGDSRRAARGARRLDPATWKAPELNVPNARRCGPAPARAGSRSKRSLRNPGVLATAPCY